MKVPFLDLKIQHAAIRDEIAIAMEEVIATTSFAGGPQVTKFEDNFARYCRCEHAVGVGSGTDALWMALLGLGIGDGDEVITSPGTFIATAEAVTYCGATPVFVDIEPETYNLDPAMIEASLTPRTKAIIPVHLFGQPADMDPILEIGRKHDLVVIEDACQAHGAEYKGHRAGSLGDAGCFSFYPGKNLGAYGEAGAIVTNDSKLAETLRMFRDHGQKKKYYHSIAGWNSRMDGLQGAILDVKLGYLLAWTEARRKNAEIYNRLLLEMPTITTPVEAEYARHVYHVYAIRAKNRDELMRRLSDSGIACGIHYPVPLHLQEAYAVLGYKKGDFPVAEQSADEFVSLPMFPELTEESISYVVEKIKEFSR